MWSTDPQSLVRIAVSAAVGYAFLLTLVRVLGPRTISKMNPSDFAITVAVGSTVANLVLMEDIRLLDGLAALVVLLLLQFGTEWLSARQTWFRGMAEGSPRMVFYEGQFIRSAMLAEHVTETAVYQAIRGEGISDLEKVHAVILEIDGSFSVIPGGEPRSESAFDDVKRADSKRPPE